MIQLNAFRHPHLVRGVVHTSSGNFVVARGIVHVTDEIGDAYGWLRVIHDEQAVGAAPQPSAPLVDAHGGV
jgi:hypothetical protein